MDAKLARYRTDGHASDEQAERILLGLDLHAAVLANEGLGHARGRCPQFALIYAIE
jgi:hypothetical protein